MLHKTLRSVQRHPAEIQEELEGAGGLEGVAKTVKGREECGGKKRRMKVG